MTTLTKYERALKKVMDSVNNNPLNPITMRIFEII